jgi:hypothetical protein
MRMLFQHLVESLQALLPLNDTTVGLKLQLWY